jgi:hypothetical protein
MSTSTKEIGVELQNHLGNDGARLMHQWMEAMRADLLALATATDVIAGSGTAAVDSITKTGE